MKEFYVSPEAEVICFAPVEDIANNLWEQEQAVVFSTRATSPVFDGNVTNPDDDGQIAP